MKHTKLVLAGLGMLGACLLFFGQLAYAHSFQAGSDVSVAQPVDGTLYAIGQTVNVTSDVNGDVLCAGQTVVISGAVHGDVLCAAQTMSITGTVDGSVRLIGQTLNLDGAIGRSASVVAQTLTINQNVMGDLSFAGNDLVANKNIGRDLGFAATSVTLNGRVGRDITGTDKHLTFGPHAIVGGTVNYHSDENASLGQGAQVTALHRTALPKTDRQSQPIWSFWGMVASWLLFVAMSLFAALVFVLVCPRALRAASDRTHNRFGWALLAGIVGSIVAPILAIVLCFTIIGLPLAFVVVVSWMLLSAFSLPVAGLWLGRLMLPKTNNAIPVILLGVLVIELLMMIPFLNVLVGVASYWIGLGSILLAIRDHAQKPDYHLRSTRG